jgi:Cu2+-exporting ATPase
VNGDTVLVGSDRFMKEHDVDMSAAAADVQQMQGRAVSPLFVATNGSLLGLLSYCDPLRPEAAAVVRALRRRGVKRIVMVTGDCPAVAKAVAESAGITRYVAEVLPEQKVEYVKSLQEKGHTVAIVGDGINDSPALAQADIGIAVQGGADIAQETAHVRLLEPNLWRVPHSIDIANQCMATIRQNWRLNFYPGCAAIGLSLFGLAGPVASTMISNGAAVLSTLNALRPLLDGGEVKSTRQEPNP